MMQRVLILGAAYGMLPGAKLSLAGHGVTLVGRADEIARMAQAPLEVHIAPRRGGDDIVLRVPVAPRAAPGQIALATPERVDPAAQDLIILAMQEPQYRDPAVAALMAEVATSGRPCLSIMNLAPPPFLERLGIDTRDLADAYASGDVWARFDPARLSLASPDPQAVRPDPARPGLLRCLLPSNFKAAPFARAEDQALLEKLAADMSHLEVAVGGVAVRPPVALVASGSLFVPLAKWPMLIAGNCRCVLPAGVRTIAEAVHADLDASAAIYEHVRDLTLRLGAREQDLVKFRSYAEAALKLARPSSLANAIAAGAVAVERVDRLIQRLLHRYGMPDDRIDAIVDAIDQRLTGNRAMIGHKA